MACVVGPSFAGMDKMDKGNNNKMNHLWAQRIEVENGVNISTDRRFSVASMPKLMAEKPNNWDPHNQKDVFKEPFEHPPVGEINDMKFLGIEAHPRDRFSMPQSTYHELGWAATAGFAPGQDASANRSAFANKVVDETNKSRTITSYHTGLHNMRDDYFRGYKRKGARNPMAHHVGFVTGLEDNPYEKTLKVPERAASCDLTGGEGVYKVNLYKEAKKVERQLYEQFNKGQFRDENARLKGKKPRPKKTNMQATHEAYQNAGRQPMQHTMGVVTDLGFEDIGSRLVYNEAESRWDVMNKYKEKEKDAKVRKMRI